jgi:phage shock protein A
MLDQAAVKAYALGSRSLSTYDTTLKDVQDAIKRLEQEIEELEALLNGGGARKAVAVVPRDW